MRPEREHLIRSLFDEYIEMYASRDDRLTARFSDNFSGYTGGGGFLVKDRDEWMRITRQDFAQVIGRIRVEMLALPRAQTAPGIIAVSLGVARLVPSRQHLPEELVRQADSALYRAKQAGRNCLQTATD